MGAPVGNVGASFEKTTLSQSIRTAPRPVPLLVVTCWSLHLVGGERGRHGSEEKLFILLFILTHLQGSRSAGESSGHGRQAVAMAIRK